MFKNPSFSVLVCLSAYAFSSPPPLQKMTHQLRMQTSGETAAGLAVMVRSAA